MVAERTRQIAPTPAVALVRPTDTSPVLVARPEAVQARLRPFAAICVNGHARTPANTGRHPGGGVRCLDCLREWHQGQRILQRRRRESSPPAECSNGHRQTFLTARLDARGIWFCLVCRRAQCAAREMAAKRWKEDRPTCGKGHPWTPENTKLDGRGRRDCRECCRRRGRESQQRRYVARKAARTSQSTAFAVSARPEAPERPLEGFDAIAAAVAIQARAYTPTRYTDLVEAGIRERRAREAAKPVGPVTPERIIEAAAGTFGVTVADLTGKDRHVEYVRPRQLAYYFMRELCQESLTEIGKRLDRDHTTVMYGVDKIERLVAAGDRETVRDLELVREALGETA